ncbi:kinase/pyrophosphorylase [Vagococcus xieshaowenii]|uniref:Kinase/pyrophosphorylase n=2 Tax=Vagococcus xieshaowenii TaxID=2562451 RepID=A0AAJ5EEE4_9ENTE|nr:kinase/pyrophosphorylase [Vagococcus xieshaowenii]TFZ41547.1 kinase/pyrophosphorylase [Vagococcus xieshaowenii]
MKKDIMIYTISDSIGETSQKLLGAVTAQYPDLTFNNNNKFSFVTQENELLEILRSALKDDAIVISTLVNKNLLTTAKNFSSKNGLQYFDLMSPLFDLIRHKAGEEPIEKPGIIHNLDSNYINKMAAIEFAVKHDDDHSPESLLEADIIILGASRTSKTPLSVYLANKGIKVANMTITSDMDAPAVLSSINPDKMIGLVMKPETLASIRSNRLDTLGLKQDSNYTNLPAIQTELDYSTKLFEQYGAYIVDATDKSIEEIAYLIENHINQNRI